MEWIKIDGKSPITTNSTSLTMLLTLIEREGFKIPPETLILGTILLIHQHDLDPKLLSEAIKDLDGMGGFEEKFRTINSIERMLRKIEGGLKQ